MKNSWKLRETITKLLLRSISCFKMCLQERFGKDLTAIYEKNSEICLKM
jgi:hypothetical protein